MVTSARTLPGEWAYAIQGPRSKEADALIGASRLALRGPRGSPKFGDATG